MPEAASSETIREPAMRFTLCQRISLWLITWTAYLFIRLLCSTLRYSISFEDDEPARDPVHGIYSFWHRCIVPASFGFRNRNVAVMTSRSYDGEYIARIIELFGFRAVRGSSSRGAVGALLGMRRELEEGRRVVFTIDGPRGPKYVAKSGPVLLASKTQVPMFAFHVAPSRAWVLPSWDALMIPKPFARVHTRISRPMPVPPDAGDATIEQHRLELQAALDRVRMFAEERVLIAAPKKN